MKLGVLFSGGKDSMYAAWLAKTYDHHLSCLVSLEASNKESYMFHTPSISQTRQQARAMNIPLLVQQTKGEKEEELEDLKIALKRAKKEFKIQGVVTGAVESVYQASRVQRICYELDLECFNPLWQKDQIELLGDIVERGFEVIITGVFAYPFDKSWLGKKIDEDFIAEMKKLQKQYLINPAGEGGEFESLVLNCPLFRRGLKVKSFEDVGKGHSWRREVVI